MVGCVAVGGNTITGAINVLASASGLATGGADAVFLLVRCLIASCLSFSASRTFSWIVRLLSGGRFFGDFAGSFLTLFHVCGTDLVRAVELVCWLLVCRLAGVVGLDCGFLLVASFGEKEAPPALLNSKTTSL